MTNKVENALQKRRLPHTICTQKPVNLALLDSQIHILEDLHSLFSMTKRFA